jgi:hypothetical protein
VQLKTVYGVAAPVPLTHGFLLDQTFLMAPLSHGGSLPPMHRIFALRHAVLTQLHQHVSTGLLRNHSHRRLEKASALRSDECSDSRCTRLITVRTSLCGVSGSIIAPSGGMACISCELRMDVLRVIIKVEL